MWVVRLYNRKILSVTVLSHITKCSYFHVTKSKFRVNKSKFQDINDDVGGISL